jgi:glutathione S-transferase
MRNFVRWTDEGVLPNLLILNWSQMLQPAAQQWSDEQLQQKLSRIPTRERREAWSRISRKPYTTEEKADALDKLLSILGRMEPLLSQSPWLFGDRFTIADIAAVPFIARIAELSPPSLNAANQPKVNAWWTEVRRRPSFAAARLQPFEEVLQGRLGAGVSPP